ncbi:hypothetical protein JCM10213_001744 [Rhodosporidiobolus nylandii]
MVSLNSEKGHPADAEAQSDSTLKAANALDGGVFDEEQREAAAPAAGPSERQRTKLAFSKIVPAGVSFQIAFWICALWLYGSLYKASDKTHRLSVVVSDFDGGSVGSSLLAAVNAVNGQHTSPTFHVLPANSTSPEDLQHRVFSGDYWGGIYATVGATDRFNAAIGSEADAATYSAAGAFVYTGVEVRYNTVWSGFVLPNLNKIVASATAIFGRETVAPLLTSGRTFGSGAAAVLVHPLGSTYANLAPFSFGTRLVINTIGFVFPSLFCFFFLMAVNGIGTLTGWYASMDLRRHLKFRLIVGAVWTLFAALSIVGWTLCFDEEYSIKGKNFVALWAIMWVYVWITYDLFDIATAYVPPQFLSHIVVFYIIAMSVSAVLFPIDVMNRLYRFQIAFPAHAVWQTMITIFGNGASNYLYRDLPILAAWIVVCKVGVVFSLKRRAKQGAAIVQARNKP